MVPSTSHYLGLVCFGIQHMVGLIRLILFYKDTYLCLGPQGSRVPILTTRDHLGNRINFSGTISRPKTVP